MLGGGGSDKIDRGQSQNLLVDNVDQHQSPRISGSHDPFSTILASDPETDIIWPIRSKKPAANFFYDFWTKFPIFMNFSTKFHNFLVKPCFEFATIFLDPLVINMPFFVSLGLTGIKKPWLPANKKFCLKKCSRRPCLIWLIKCE